MELSWHNVLIFRFIAVISSIDNKQIILGPSSCIKFHYQGISNTLAIFNSSVCSCIWKSEISLMDNSGVQSRQFNTRFSNEVLGEVNCGNPNHYWLSKCLLLCFTSLNSASARSYSHWSCNLIIIIICLLSMCIYVYENLYPPPMLLLCLSLHSRDPQPSEINTM